MIRRPPRSTLFPYTTLFRSRCRQIEPRDFAGAGGEKLALNFPGRSEEHTSELQSHSDLVCRLLLEKKKTSCQANSWSSPAAHISASATTCSTGCRSSRRYPI